MLEKKSRIYSISASLLSSSSMNLFSWKLFYSYSSLSFYLFISFCNNYDKKKNIPTN